MSFSLTSLGCRGHCYDGVSNVSGIGNEFTSLRLQHRAQESARLMGLIVHGVEQKIDRFVKKNKKLVWDLIKMITDKV